MAKTIHVTPNPNQTYQVQIQLPDYSEPKAGGQFLDEKRLQVELQQHGCTPEQIQQGLQAVRASPGREIDIVVE